MSGNQTSSAAAAVPVSPARGSDQGGCRRLAAGALFIFLAAFAVYWPALRGQFLWDDTLVVQRNPLVTGELGFGSIWFRTDFPLSNVAFWLERLIWGNHVLGYHVVNVLLHATGAVLLWRVLAQLKVPASWLAAMIFTVHPLCVASVAWISELKNTLSLPFFLLSLLWYLRSDSQFRALPSSGPQPSTLNPQPSWYWLSLLAFALALLSKTSTVMLPVVLLACAWWQRGHIGRRDWLRVSPFFALALAFGLMSIGFQVHGAMAGVAVQNESLWGRLAASGVALWFYLGKALLPLHLSMIYPRWKIEAASACSYLPLLLWCAVLSVCWGLSRICPGGTRTKEPQRREERGEPNEGNGAETAHRPATGSQPTEAAMSLRPSRLCGSIGGSSTPTLRLVGNLGRHLLFGLGCFTVMLFPVLGFFDMYFLALSRVADHFAYLPLTALAALGAAGLGWVAQGRVRCKAASSLGADREPSRLAAAPTAPLGSGSPSTLACLDVLRARTARGPVNLMQSWAFVLVGGGLVAGLAALAMLRAEVFLSEETLWRDTLNRNPAAWCAHANLGWILASQRKYDEARDHLMASLKLNPNNAQAHANLGRVLALQGHNAEAEPEFQAAVRIKPKDSEIRRSYASVLAEQGRKAESEKQLRELLQLKPDLEASSQLASLLYQTAKFGEAVAEYRQLVAARPNQPEALSNLAWLLATSPDSAVRNGTDAVQFAEQACRLTGYQRAPMVGSLAAAYAEAGRFTEAVVATQRAIELAQSSGDSRFAAVNEQLLSLYRAGKPYHMPFPALARPGVE
jgi:Flp pilus assembly protein TadD